jgi:hypothetical protein
MIGELPMEIGVTLGKVRLIARDSLTLNRLDLNNWVASAADTAAGWKPVPSESSNVDLTALVSATVPTLYLASGVEAKEPADAVLDIGCKGVEAVFWLNDRPVASLSQRQFGHSGNTHRDSTLRVHLEKGPNILLCKVTAGISAEDHRVCSIRATLVTDPGQKEKAGLRLLPAQAVLSNPMMRQGKAAAAGAVVRPIDDFSKGVSEGWKFSQGSCQNLQVVESGDAARGKVLKRELNSATDVQRAVLFREIAPGILSDGQQGIRVWLKSSYPVWIDLGLAAGNTQYVAKVRAGTDWEESRVPFDQFIKFGTAETALTPADLKRINRLTVMPRNDDGLWSELTLFISDLGVLQSPASSSKP